MVVLNDVNKVLGVVSTIIFWCIFLPFSIYGWIKHSKLRNNFIFQKRYGLCSLILSVHFLYFLLFAGFYNLVVSFEIKSFQRIFYAYVYFIFICTISIVINIVFCVVLLVLCGIYYGVYGYIIMMYVGIMKLIKLIGIF